jgi:hypothetical protein
LFSGRRQYSSERKCTRQPTTIWPVIFGWIEQKYLHVPGVSNQQQVQSADECHLPE